jgi:hypothetical protein
VEYKFCNLHAANQIENGRLICSANDEDRTIVPVNRELMKDADGIQYNDLFYCHDYRKVLRSVNGNANLNFDDAQKHYKIAPLCLYENTIVQSPFDINLRLKHRLKPIHRSETQIRTFSSVVKKYRPIVMPNVRDIFNDCINDKTKYEVDRDNDYGIFGWCTIPSKTMVNMEYNEQAIIVPSSYDHHNRIGGNNFLQMDNDLERIYQKWVLENP